MGSQSVPPVCWYGWLLISRYAPLVHEDLGSLSRCVACVTSSYRTAESKTALRSALTAQCPPQLGLPGLPDVPIVEAGWFMDLLSRSEKTRLSDAVLELTKRALAVGCLSPWKSSVSPSSSVYVATYKRKR